MKPLHKIFTALAVLTVFCTGVVVGQQVGDDTSAILRAFDVSVIDTKAYALNPDADKINSVAEKFKNGPLRLSQTYGKVVRDQPAFHSVLAREIANYYGGKYGAKSAVQASQIADQSAAEMTFLIAAQNQRIIELLEAQAKAKTP